ncbi:MAG TPA: hypothetical protein EYP59_10145 [Thiotrichaceae bacterium]|nr:hypothetical protein [Thiotrichaceae bacterium]
MQFLATQAANRHGIDHRLFHALIKHESAWDPDALSPKGARGLTQIMPRTGETEFHAKVLRAKLLRGMWFGTRAFI